METRIALIGIIVENPDSVEQLNHLLHEYGSFIVGRMGIPYGRIGRLDGIGVKTVYSNK